MQIFDVLSKDLEVKNHFFLEASAGTGKTFSIEHLVTRLVLEGVDFKKILVVTFTRAATRELKRRIVSTLINAQKNLLTDEPSSIEYLEKVRIGEESSKKEALLRIQQALQSQSSASVYTIHGFCYRMLQQFSFEAHSPLTLFNPDEGSTKGLYVEGMMGSFRAQVMKEYFFPSQIHLLFKQAHKNLTNLISSSLPLMEGDKGLSEETPKVERKAQCLIEQVHQLKSRISLEEIEGIWGFYKSVIDRAGNLKEEHTACFSLWREAYSASEVDYSWCNRFISHKNSLFSSIRFDNRKKQKLTKSQEDALNRIEEALLSWNAFINDYTDPLLIQLALVRVCKKAMKEKWKTQDLLLTDDLLHEMVEALDREKFVNSIREQYEAIIIDEFQDTDPLQWKIFSYLFLEEKKAPVFCLVGDPKQSIYSFRSADLDVFFAAKETFSKSNQYALLKNFRSSKTLVEGCNRLFSCMPSWFPYYEVDAFQTEDSLISINQKSIHFFGTEGAPHKRGLFPSEELEKTLFFPFITTEIIRLHGEGIGLDEQVILVKDRYQARRLEKFLKDARIPVVSNAKMNLSESPVFLVFERLFSLLTNPYNINELKQLIAASPFNAPLSLLEKDLSDEHYQNMVSGLQELRDILFNKGIVSALHTFFHKPLCTSMRSLKELLASQESLDLYQDAIQLLEILVQASSSFHAGAIDALHFLQRLKAKGGEDNKKFFRKPSKEGSCVTIMTTFTSKGLEFSVVFALGCMTRSSKQPAWVYSKRHKKVIPFEGNEDEALEVIYAQEKEKLRQLYVALTRAKKRVYIPFCFSPGTIVAKGCASPLDLFYASLFYREEDIEKIYARVPELECTLLEKWVLQHPSLFSLEKLSLSPIEKFVPQKEERVSVREPRSFLPTKSDQKFYSFSSLIRHHTTKSVPISSEDLLPAGAHIGNIFHSIFEKIFQNGWHPSRFQEQRKGLISKAILQYNLLEHEEAVIRIIEETLKCPLQGGFNLSEVHPSHVLQETEFLFPLEKESLMKGFIDLIFFHEGKFHILDWKSNRLEKYEEEHLRGAMEQHEYFLQGNIYYEALMRYMGLLGFDPSKHFGGIHYLFIRGPAVYSFAPTIQAHELIKR